MTLSVADIERWDPEEVRAVARAARARAEATSAAADALASLPAFDEWEGSAADAAREAIERTRRDLSAQGAQAQAVAQAADLAADSIAAIQSALAGLKAEAAAYGLEIDPTADRVVPIPGHRRSVEQITGLQARLDSLVEQANSVDADLSAAIQSAGERPRLDGPLPDDAEQFHDLWQQLSAEERDLLYRRDHSIGNHPGMPVGEQDGRDADHYNRLHLAEELATAEATDSSYRDDLRALDDMLRADPDLHLMLVDTSGAQLHAAFAVGDPDTAEHVSVTTPGLNSSVSDSGAAMAFEAHVLQRLSLRQLDAAGRGREKVAAVGWIGYDAPQINVSDGPAEVLAGLDGVTHDDVAAQAAVELARFYDGVVAAHGGKPLDLTAIGHSYGSLTTSFALQQPGQHGVDNAIFYGSPGISATTPEQLQVAPGHVFTMEAPSDPIQLAFDVPPIARALAPALAIPMPPVGLLANALLDYADATDVGEFGPNPATNPNFTAMATGEASVEDRFGTLNLAGAQGHSQYPEALPGPHNSWVPRTTNYNLAAVVAGLPDNVIRR